MKFNFENLDEQTRKLMLVEIEHDHKSEVLYYSKRFNDTGIKLYLGLLKQAAIDGDEQSLATALKANKCFNTHEERRTKSGMTQVKIPETANETLTESEFNRFYMRALCIRAIENNQSLLIYRARHSDNPRVESEMLIGKEMDPAKLLAELRENIGCDTALGLPTGPNSGLTVKLNKHTA